MRTLIICVAALAVSTTASGQVIESIEVTRGPEAIASFGAAPLDGWIYVFGGHTGRAHHHSRVNLSRRFFRIRSDDPARIETLPGGDGYQGLALVATGGRLWRIGGVAAINHPEDDEVMHSTSSVMSFDPAQRIWSEAPALPSPRSSHDAAVLGRTIYVFGGWNLQRDDEGWLDHGFRATVSANGMTWERIDQPFVRRAVALAAYDGRVFVIGGLNESGGPSTEVDIYSPSDGTWTKGPTLPSMGFGPTAFGTPRGLFVSLLSGAVLRLSDDGRSWVNTGQLAFPRFFARMMPAGVDRFACIAGAGRLGHLSTIEWLTIGDRPAGNAETPVSTPASGQGEKPVTPRGTAEERIGHFPLDDGAATGPGPFVHLKLANPVPAKNRQIIFRDRNWLYFFGGNDSLKQHDFARHNFTCEGIRVDLATQMVESVPPLPRPLQSSLAATIGTDDIAQAFVVGGFGWDAEGGKGAKSRDEILVYKPTVRTWARRGTMPLPLTQFGLAERGDELWIFGGLNYDPARGRKAAFEHSSSVYRGKTKLGGDLVFAETEFPMPTPRRAFGGASLGDRYYVTGGMREDFQPVKTFVAFDFVTKEWTELPAPGARISPHLVTVGEKLYLVGGSALNEDLEATPCETIEVFDPRMNTWSTHPRTLPVSPRHLRVFGFNGRLWLVSTHNETNELDIVIFKP